MPRRKTVKRRNQKRRTLKRYRKKQKVGGLDFKSLINQAATTLRLSSPYPGWTYANTSDDQKLYSSKLEKFLDVGNIDYESRNLVLAFPRPYFSKGFDNFIYQDKTKIIDLYDIDADSPVKALKYPDELVKCMKSGTEYIYLAYNYM